MLFAKKTVVGWEEWVGLPDLGLPMIKAKVDTGAKTSCLHATRIRVVKVKGKRFVRFRITPVPKNKKIYVKCRAPLTDRRFVIDSGGHREKRYVITTPITIGRKKYDIEVTLTDRRSMRFRMLLGRQAMGIGQITVDPVRSHLLGKIKMNDVLELYKQNLKLDLKQAAHETK